MMRIYLIIDIYLITLIIYIIKKRNEITKYISKGREITEQRKLDF